ncbi:hypothetical protein L6R29_17460 [Myxococcota bacterium]|nr:hypothetical protein [Myxococcota bacterium]
MRVYGRFMRRIGRWGGLFGVSVLLAGCPLPVKRTAVVQPSMVLRVVDAKGQVLGKTKMSLTWASHPHRRIHKTTSYTADDKGEIRIVEELRGEWIMPLMMHGVPFHFWVYCIRREGYETHEAEVHRAERGKLVTVQIQLKQGKPQRPCFFERRQAQAGGRDRAR